jgi:DNA gyrase/topoisomerase IV subunit B
MGTVALARNAQTQGIFPIRGKIINAFNCTKERFYENEEVQAIHRITFGRDYKRGDKVTLEDVKVEKIIIMADGDVDGAHISALLERMFIMYYPFLIEAGIVYKALPPLFSAKIGKSEKYFTEQIDIIKFMQRDFLEHHTFMNAKKIPVENKTATIFFMRNADYTYYLNKVANTYALYPSLLEMILFNYVQHKDKIDFTSLQKDIKSTYRFMDAKMIDKNHIKVSGVIDKSNVVIISDKFLSDCEAVIRILKANDYLYYYIDKEKKSLYEVMTAYEKSTPSGIKRYKGLGEMNKNQMAESTLRADMNRTLIRYTMNDAKETFETIRSYESNSKLILNLCNNVTRDDLNE